MQSQVTRRGFIGLFGSAAYASAIMHANHAVADKAPDLLTRKLAALETALGARLGASIHDIETGRRWQHRATERFPMCSTFKMIACAAILKRVDKGREDLRRRIRFGAKDVVTYSPVTKSHADGPGMALSDICAAAMTQSDNTAANLILKALGGPSAVTAFARSLGDPVTRLDRWETELNQATPGDPRDTTTPAAMSANLRTLALGSPLSARSRDQLVTWMVSNRTGDAKLRAGLPKDWRIGDKTGGGGHGTMADVAIIWPPERKPVIASVYVTETKASFDVRNAAIAEVGRAIQGVLGA